MFTHYFKEEIPSWPKMMILHVLKYLNEDDWIIFMHYQVTTSNFLALKFLQIFNTKDNSWGKF